MQTTDEAVAVPAPFVVLPAILFETNEVGERLPVVFLAGLWQECIL